jgi:hypothetical protein
MNYELSYGKEAAPMIPRKGRILGLCLLIPALLPAAFTSLDICFCMESKI